MGSYAIMRCKKLATMGCVAASLSHCYRDRETPNADGARTPDNEHMAAASASKGEAMERIQNLLPANRRKDAVLAVEYMMSASPDWWVTASAEQQAAFFERSYAWLAEKYGADRIVTATVHRDETSPHLSAFVVPLTQDGRLSAKEFIGNRRKLSEDQTSYAARLADLGLERGIEGSKATHTTVKQYYAEIQKEPQDVTISPQAIEPRKYKNGFLGKLGVTTHAETEENIAARLTEEVREAYKPAIEAAKRYHAEKPANEARERTLAELRQKAVVVREIPLESVLERLECIRDSKDKTNWRTPVGRVTVTGVKFFNHDMNQGGGGAIDLVIHVLATDYKGSVGWLARQFGTGAVLSESVARLKPAIESARKAPAVDLMEAHKPVPERWAKVRGYLVNERRLSASLVDQLHKGGWVYADKYANCVFVLGKGKGLSLRGTGDKPYHGVRGEKAPFVLGALDVTQTKVAFVESPIDALSLRELGFKGRIVATMGNAKDVVQRQADKYREKGLTVVAAFDNDKAGDRMCLALGYPAERLRPERKDWNAVLKAKRLTPEERQADELEKKQKHSRSHGLSL